MSVSVVFAALLIGGVALVGLLVVALLVLLLVRSARRPAADR